MQFIILLHWCKFKQMLRIAAFKTRNIKKQSEKIIMMDHQWWSRPDYHWLQIFNKKWLNFSFSLHFWKHLLFVLLKNKGVVLFFIGANFFQIMNILTTPEIFKLSFSGVLCYWLCNFVKSSIPAGPWGTIFLPTMWKATSIWTICHSTAFRSISEGCRALAIYLCF